MSDMTEELVQTTALDVEVEERSFQPIVALIGVVVIALGVSGLVDDSGLLEHPWWVTLVATGVAGCAMVILRTWQALRVG